MRVFISETDKGVYHAMNKGIHLAHGEYCIFMNGGDSFYDHSVIKQFYQLEPKADIIYGGMVEILIDNIKKEKFLTPVTDLKAFFYKQTFPHQAVFIRKSLFDTFGLYDENLKIMADRDFLARVIFQEKIAIQHFPILISNFYFNGLSAKLKNSKLHKKEIKTYRNRHFGKLYMIRRLINIAFSRATGRPV